MSSPFSIKVDIFDASVLCCSHVSFHILRLKCKVNKSHFVFFRILKKYWLCRQNCCIFYVFLIHFELRHVTYAFPALSEEHPVQKPAGEHSGILFLRCCCLQPTRPLQAFILAVYHRTAHKFSTMSQLAFWSWVKLGGIFFVFFSRRGLVHVR